MCLPRTHAGASTDDARQPPAASRPRLEGGEFGEIEAVIAAGDDPERSRAAVDEILAALGIAPADLIGVSYFELLAAR